MPSQRCMVGKIELPRPKGALSKDHEDRRSDIIAALVARLCKPDAMHASYRELAAAAGVSTSTMQHYFGKRTAVVQAVVEESQRQAAGKFAALAQPQGDFASSIRGVIDFTLLGFQRFGVGDVYAMGLTEGLNNRAIGPVVVASVLEPSIEAIADRLREHQALGEMRSDRDARHAAIMLLSPLLVLLLHQGPLFGQAAYPANLELFCTELANNFVNANAA